MKIDRYHDFYKQYFQPQSQTRSCEHEGCQEAGIYRAPKNRYQLNTYIFLCLPHVRDYNSNWNYYEGMNEIEIERHNRADVTWQRPTWSISNIMKKSPSASSQNFIDPLNLFNDNQSQKHPHLNQKIDTSLRSFPSHSKEQKALLVLTLTSPISFAEIKAMYRQLVKEFHPDANQGCKFAEERIKKINEAFSILKKTYHP